MLTGPTPDITPAQIAALAVFIVGQLVAFGVISGTSTQLAVSITSALIAVAWKFADAYLRGKRCQARVATTSSAPPAA